MLKSPKTVCDCFCEALRVYHLANNSLLRIVDDLLTLSKLDSNLLQINQAPVRATSILDDMRRVFEIEAGRAEIELRIQADPSIKAMNVDNVMLDTGRVHQILINLITNALKFTKDKPQRRVTITMGSSEKRPSDGILSSIDFALPHTLSDTERESEAVASGPETFFIWFTVSDSGRGIKPDEKTKLFSRFQQASPRTYSKYGGSGLGLFISRELAELQGGEIGIASELDVGSTFAFFVKTQPAAPPIDQRLKNDIAIRPRSGSAQTSFSNEIVQIHVLVAEDNPTNQKVLKRQLTEYKGAGSQVSEYKKAPLVSPSLTSTTTKSKIAYDPLSKRSESPYGYGGRPELSRDESQQNLVSGAASMGGRDRSNSPARQPRLPDVEFGQFDFRHQH
ncbi:hypothetical protein D6C83_07061 [Aureobasidium pullulans]|uniref:histidine kinase n=1 Tax=Aureobasidium pullulans TaxID=5580 RepID=A0A4T0BB84_AURPU|nr:hypothetical protein D6C83_07061 [Aureobasidium pullulans]